MRSNNPVRWRLLRMAFVATPLLVLPGTAPADDSDSDEQTTTLHGEYVWTYQNEAENLTASFVQTKRPRLNEELVEVEPAEYDVEFKFRFNGQPHTYSGTAKGSLTEGALKGTVFNENKRRKFVFRGEFTDGRLTGEHGEIRRGSERRTGTFWLE